MKKFWRIVLMIQVTQAAIVVGSRMGALLRTLLTGQPTQGGVFKYEDEAGHKFTTTPPITHSLPGLALALLGRKRPWLWGFIGSFVAAALLGDALEKRVMVEIARRIEAAQKPGVPSNEVQ